MKWITVLPALCGVTGVFAVPHHFKRSSYAVKESHVVPAQWKKLGRAAQDHVIELRLGLKQKSFDELEQRLYQVSDPDHEHYGKHLSPSDVNSLIAPDKETSNSVHEWLEANDVRLDTISYSRAKDWLVVALPVAEIERLLSTEYHVYKHAETGTEVVRAPKFSLPRVLHDHIDTIQPTNYFGDIQKMTNLFRLSHDHINPHDSYTPPTYPWHHDGSGGPPSVTELSAVCNTSAVTSLCLRTLYNTVDYVPQVPEKNFLAMTAFLNETANISDFNIFLSRQRQDASLNYTYNYTTINGGINFQSLEPPGLLGVKDLEANLDSQIIGGFVYPTKFEVFSTGGSPLFKPDLNTVNDTNEPYLSWLSYVLTLSDSALPKTISTSYGDDEQTVPYSYAKRACQEFAQLGARGVSLFFCSGDSGVGANGTCVANDGSGTRKFLQVFPASCPYVTTVGGTRNIEPEIVAYDVKNGFVTGSGLSNYFARPSYQDTAVESYLHSIGNLHAGLYNASGRAYPDLSAQGYHYVMIYAGNNKLLDGTSCSTPTMTSVFTLVNDALIADGKAPMGFLNPWLYKYGHNGFNDITIGNTWGCNSSGFPAQEGWDLATGWGTPDFKKIRALEHAYRK